MLLAMQIQNERNKSTRKQSYWYIIIYSLPVLVTVTGENKRVGIIPTVYSIQVYVFLKASPASVYQSFHWGM